MINMHHKIRTERAPTEIGVVTISNVVCTANLINVPKMEDVANAFWGQFNKSGFAAACRIRLNNPRCTVLVFNVGKLVATAVRSLVEGTQAFNAVLSHLTKCGFKGMRIEDICVENYASTFYTPYGLNLRLIQDRFPDVIWFRRNFAGAKICRANDITILLFESGRNVITGGKNVNDLLEAAQWCIDNLEFAAIRDKAPQPQPRQIKSD